MELALQFLLFLRKLISHFRHRWNQSTRRLWCIFALVRSRILSQRPNTRAKIPRNVEYRPAESLTTVICASQFPPSPTLIAGGDTPTSTLPTPGLTSIQVRQPETVNPEDTVYETHENYNREHLDADPVGGRPILQATGMSLSLSTPSCFHSERITPFLPSLSNPPPQDPYRSTLQHPAYRSPSQFAYHPPPQHPHHTPLNLDGAEVAARNYLDGSRSPRCSSPVASIYPRPVAAAGASQVYHASRPISQVRMLQQMRNPPRRRVEFPTSAPTHQGVRNPREFPPPEPRTSGSIHCHRPDATTKPGRVLPAMSKGSLRPMVGIDRYEKHKAIVIEASINSHVSPPVTIQFVR